MARISLLLVLLLQCSVAGPTALARSAESFSAVATWVRCHDGDTCTFRVFGKRFKARISGIDAPELKQPFGTTARNAMSDLLSRARQIKLECRGKSYDRKVCSVEADGQDVARALVEKGLAHDAPQYSKGKYKDAEGLGRRKKLGIWASGTPVNPKCFRHPASRGC